MNKQVVPIPMLAVCALCTTPFQARTSYGLCKNCWSRDRLREWDRLISAQRQAERLNVPATLTLVQWMSTASDFKGLCAYCLEMPFSLIEMVDPRLGLIWENVVPICKACHTHKHTSFEEAIRRVQVYLATESDGGDPVCEESGVSATEHLSASAFFDALFPGVHDEE